MFWRRAEPEPPPPVQWGRGVVTLRDERLLADPSNAELPVLLARICSLSAVWLVEIDHHRRQATLRISLERRPADILGELAAALQSAPAAAHEGRIRELLEHAPPARHHTALLREANSADWTLGPPVASGLRRASWLMLAAGGFGLSVVGVVVPGVPTVPFVLLTSYCLVRSSPALNDRLLRSRLFGPLLYDWQRYGGVRPGVKWTATCATLVILLVSALAFEMSGWTLVVVLSLAAIGILWIWRLPSLPDRQPPVPVMPAALAAAAP